MVLTIVSGPNKGRFVTIGEGDIAIVGSAVRVDLRVGADAAIDERHFSVSCGRGGAQLLDLESRTGTMLNGRRVSDASLHRGDEIRAGGTSFIVSGDELPEPSSVEDLVAHAAAPEAWGEATRPAPAVFPAPSIWEVVHDPSIVVRLLPSDDPVSGARLTVIMKMTFSLRGGEPRLSEIPLPVLTADQSFDGSDLVQCESDNVPFKPVTDVVLVGNAYAPEGAPVTELPVGLRVGKLHRGIVVVGDRRWQYHRVGPPTMSLPRPFKTMPLTYDRSFGGMDEAAGVYCPENPVGRGIIGKNGRESVDDKPLPNLEHPRSRVRSWDDRPRPVGFGFYGRAWQPRLAYATGGEQGGAQPGAIDPRFWNGAHPDLQTRGYLRGNEEVELINVHRRHPRLGFSLPGLRPTITVSRWKVPPDEWLAEHMVAEGQVDAEPPIFAETVKANLDTLVFLPDQEVFYEVFRGVCGLSSVESLEVACVTVRIEGGKP